MTRNDCRVAWIKTFETYHVRAELRYWKLYKDFHRLDKTRKNNSGPRADGEIVVVAAADSADVVVSGV